MLKNLYCITESEYDTLNYYKQKNYTYCKKCGRYWNNKAIDKCVCYYENKAKEIYENNM